MNYLAVLLGGFLGAVTRGAINNLPIFLGGIIPLKTMIINLTGSFCLAFILTFVSKGVKLSPRITLGLTTGFLGAFTTFSTFTVETLKLADNGHFIWAASYLLISNLGGLSLGWLGLKLALKVKSNSGEVVLTGEQE